MEPARDSLTSPNPGSVRVAEPEATVVEPVLTAASSRRSLRMLEAALEQTSLGLVGTLPPTDEGAARIVYANAAFLDRTGFTSEELCEHGWSLLLGPESDLTEERRVRVALRKGKAASFESILYRKDGSTYIAQLRTRPAREYDGLTMWLTTEEDVTERKKTEGQLRTLRGLIDEAADFIFSIDATQPSEGGPFFTYANKAMLAAGGYTLEEIIGRSPSMFFGPDTDSTAVRSLTDHLQRGESANGALRVYRKDGTSFWGEFNGRAMLDELTQQPKRWIAVGRDITDRYRIAQELTVLRSAIEAADDSIAVYEIDQVTSKPRVMFMNDAILRHSGFSRQELRETPTGVGPETDQAKVNELRRKLLAGDSARVRLRLYRKDGTTYWGEITAQPIKDDRGRVTHIVSIERDVTDTISREQELERDNRVLASLMEVSRRLFGALSRESLRAHLLSGIERLTGVKPLERAGFQALADPFLQRAEQSRVPIVDRSRERAAFAIPGSGSSPTAIVEVDAAGDGGRLERSAILALQLLVQNFRTALQNVALYEEIEERRSAVVELNQTKSDLIAMLAHDFRGPLTTIMGFADLMRTEQLDREEQVQILNMIVSSADSLTRLANDTLSMSRMEENELTLEIGAVDFVALAREVAREFSDQRSVGVKTAEDSILGRADAARLRQALENLVGNAVKYSPAGGDVEFEVERHGEGVALRIRDSGIGIAPEDVERIFSRFARGSNAQRSGIAGTGFGLYISRQIIERHGGMISAHSSLGVGSTFAVELPLVPGKLVVPLRVLLGDREGDVRSLTTHTLRVGGHAVKTCGTWNELDREIVAVPYDLAIIDAESFGEQAYSVQAFLDACNAASIPVIVIGADRLNRFEGVAATLTKPYLAADLFAAVDRLDPRKSEAPPPRFGATQGH